MPVLIFAPPINMQFKDGGVLFSVHVCHRMTGIYFYAPRRPLFELIVPILSIQSQWKSYGRLEPVEGHKTSRRT